ncbi:tafazzin [Neocloeon triangulifer]|uniref:tafazzin n=1 Tax=Neocloeon triangulifer TaxID=2078957 RepID=UPI00286F69C7|nr:tafazzin [Neocloeon triangulifer]
MSNNNNVNLYNPDWMFPILRQPPSRCWKLLSSFVLGSVGLINKVITSQLNTRKVFNKEILHAELDRPKKIPLITVSNHHSCMDDPGLWGAMLNSWEHLCDRNVMRWSLAAHDICFTNKIHSYFFMMGKCIPVIRGAGVEQEAIKFCSERLSEGSWVHVFPEGKVNMTQEPMRIKWGVGKLVWDCPEVPTIIPMWHVGMEEILPNEPPYRPQTGKKITIYVGNPIQLRGLLSSLKNRKVDVVTARKEITDVIQDKMLALKPIAEKLHREWT